MWLLFFCFAVVALAQDVMVPLTGGGADPNHLMVWGDYASGFEFKTFLRRGNPVNIGAVSWVHGHQRKIVAFTEGRAPGLWECKALPGHSCPAITVAYPAVVTYAVKAWVLCFEAASCGTGPLPAAFGDRIMNELAGVNALWLAQSAGIRLDLSDRSQIIMDRTSEAAKRTSFADFNYSPQTPGPKPAKCSDYPALTSAMLDKGALNLYFVRTVQNQTGRAETCSSIPNVAIFGNGFAAGLMAHEIGHNHYLQHAELTGDPVLIGAGTKNVMWSTSPDRRNLSEGELYRMHFERSSVRNRRSLLFFQPGMPPRTDGHDCNSPPAGQEWRRKCPPVGTQLIPDP